MRKVIIIATLVIMALNSVGCSAVTNVEELHTSNGVSYRYERDSDGNVIHQYRIEEIK